MFSILIAAESYRESVSANRPSANVHIIAAYFPTCHLHKDRVHILITYSFSHHCFVILSDSLDENVQQKFNVLCHLSPVQLT
jgi:hypothetical protein